MRVGLPLDGYRSCSNYPSAARPVPYLFHGYPPFHPVRTLRARAGAPRPGPSPRPLVSAFGSYDGLPFIRTSDTHLRATDGARRARRPRGDDLAPLPQRWARRPCTLDRLAACGPGKPRSHGDRTISLNTLGAPCGRRIRICVEEGLQPPDYSVPCALPPKGARTGARARGLAPRNPFGEKNLREWRVRTFRPRPRENPAPVGAHKSIHDSAIHIILNRGAGRARNRFRPARNGPGETGFARFSRLAPPPPGGATFFRSAKGNTCPIPKGKGSSTQISGIQKDTCNLAEMTPLPRGAPSGNANLVFLEECEIHEKTTEDILG